MNFILRNERFPRFNEGETESILSIFLGKRFKRDFCLTVSRICRYNYRRCLSTLAIVHHFRFQVISRFLPNAFPHHSSILRRPLNSTPMVTLASSSGDQATCIFQKAAVAGASGCVDVIVMGLLNSSRCENDALNTSFFIWMVHMYVPPVPCICVLSLADNITNSIYLNKQWANDEVECLSKITSALLDE